MNRLLPLSFICIVLFFCNGCFVSNNVHNVVTNSKHTEPQVEWLTLEQASKKNKRKQKKILIDFYTDWCAPCKKMDQTTFQNPAIVNYINKHFYAVKINGESTKPIDFKGKTYQYITEDYTEYHQLTRTLLSNKITYPSFVFLDKNLEIIQTLPGYLDPKSFDMVLHYFEGDYYQTMPWSNFTKEYKSPIEEEKIGSQLSQSFDIETIFVSE